MGWCVFFFSWMCVDVTHQPTWSWVESIDSLSIVLKRYIQSILLANKRCLNFIYIYIYIYFNRGKRINKTQLKYNINTLYHIYIKRDGLLFLGHLYVWDSPYNLSSQQLWNIFTIFFSFFVSLELLKKIW